jgi:acyl carrier protein
MQRPKDRSENIRARVIEIVERVLGPQRDSKELHLELTSLKMLELIVALEEDFDIHISEDAPLASITSSVDAITEYLRPSKASDLK